MTFLREVQSGCFYYLHNIYLAGIFLKRPINLDVGLCQNPGIHGKIGLPLGDPETNSPDLTRTTGVSCLILNTSNASISTLVLSMVIFMDRYVWQRIDPVPIVSYGNHDFMAFDRGH